MLNGKKPLVKHIMLAVWRFVDEESSTGGTLGDNAINAKHGMLRSTNRPQGLCKTYTQLKVLLRSEKSLLKTTKGDFSEHSLSLVIMVYNQLYHIAGILKTFFRANGLT